MPSNTMLDGSGTVDGGGAPIEQPGPQDSRSRGRRAANCPVPANRHATHVSAAIGRSDAVILLTFFGPTWLTAYRVMQAEAYQIGQNRFATLPRESSSASPIHHMRAVRSDRYGSKIDLPVFLCFNIVGAFERLSRLVAPALEGTPGDCGTDIAPTATF